MMETHAPAIPSARRSEPRVHPLAPPPPEHAQRVLLVSCVAHTVQWYVVRDDAPRAQGYRED